MFRILHLDRKTNVEVLEMAKVKQTLLRAKLQYFGHLIRGNGKKTTDGRKGRRDKTQRKAKDLDKSCDRLVWPKLYEMC